MNSSKQVVVAFTMLLVIVLLGQSAWAAGNSGKRHIKHLVHANAERMWIVARDADWDNPDACDRSDQLILKSADLASERVYLDMLAMVLSAHLADREIAARVKGCKTVGAQSYPVIVQLTMH